MSLLTGASKYKTLTRALRIPEPAMSTICRVTPRDEVEVVVVAIARVGVQIRPGEWG